MELSMHNCASAFLTIIYDLGGNLFSNNLQLKKVLDVNISRCSETYIRPRHACICTTVKFSFSLFLLDSESENPESETPEVQRSKSMLFRANVKLDSISSITLVLRRNPQVLTDELLKKHRLLIVRIVGYPNRLSYLIGHPKIVETNGNWVKLDVTSIIKSKGDDTVLTNVSIEVLCEECGRLKGFRSSRKRRPFLLFSMKAITKTRERRSVKGSGSCSLQKFNVNFARMNYNFVLYPKEFPLNYCRGLCKIPDKRALFLSRINFSNQSKTIPKENCCVESEMKSLSVLYMKNGQIQSNVLRNVTAVNCHCA